MKTCAKCGTENPDDATFCANCGYAFTPEEAVTGAAAPPPPPSGMGAQPGGTMPPPAAPPPQGMGLQQGGVAPPPPPTGQPPAAYPPQAPPPGAPYPGALYPGGPYPVVAQVNNSKATASLVLGIIGLVICPIICSLLAIILGSSAKNEIAASGGRQTGESNATAGIILGWIGLALYIVGFIIWAIIAAVVASQASMALMPAALALLI